MRTLEIKDCDTTVRIISTKDRLTCPHITLVDVYKNWASFIFSTRRKLQATINALQRALDEWPQRSKP